MLLSWCSTTGALSKLPWRAAISDAAIIYIKSTRTGERLTLYAQHISDLAKTVDYHQQQQPNPSIAMARDPITCHVLNTLTGTPAANLPCTLTLLSSSSGNTSKNTPTERTFTAITDSDGRIKTWSPSSSPSSSPQTDTVSSFLESLPAPASKTNWSIRFDVGPWFEAQGVESFWPEVEVKFTVRGRGVEGEEGWRHYHVPVLLGPWNYSTYRGS
ncbi:transthyretin domain protein [Talaromyces stipitatus ATCC 10500]|uniref:hydroxyisourate hydrolase n=1 Tax=Talaromyces stipitatus (strain ATCC 10500 / CBS 375.48 / QM 6759 / NRRL 1006) TaxID=441959 RepID=B8M4Y8_TALSN|nr:transthyretin domain protein [Talaromyces stipitatus ATCC 10500]EED19423.1 transthyretin domain protein [Talaromyces stipitatus ATCC 10500]